MADRMKELAIEKYGCIEFYTLTEGDKEVAISYWDNLEQIKEWKQNIEHKEAQKIGREKWYKSYKIEIAKIERSYGSK